MGYPPNPFGHKARALQPKNQDPRKSGTKGIPQAQERVEQRDPLLIP